MLSTVCSDPWTTDDEVEAAFSASLSLSIGVVTTALVFGHFLVTNGRLMYLLLFNKNSVLNSLYHSEFIVNVQIDWSTTQEDALAAAAMAASTVPPTQNSVTAERKMRSEKMLAAFDNQVAEQAAQLLDATLWGRLERRFSKEKRQEYETSFAALRAQARPGYVPEAEDWLHTTEKILEVA